MLRVWTARFLPPVLHEPCGPTLVLGVHGIATYARFSMLKKPDFNPVPSFYGPTSRSSLGLKTLCTIAMDNLIKVCLCFYCSYPCSSGTIVVQLAFFLHMMLYATSKICR